MTEQVSEKELIKQIEDLNYTIELISNELSFCESIDDFKIELDETVYRTIQNPRPRRHYKIKVVTHKCLTKEE